MFTRRRNGQIFLQMLFILGGVLIVAGGIVSWASFNLRITQQTANKEVAFQIAEAGIEYYRWHLAHAQSDYQDGTGHPGPYVHTYTDKDGNTIGSFTLDITAPLTGSTIVTITSTGVTTRSASQQRSITVQLAIPSLAKYAVAANEAIRFGEGTEVFGPVHSNGGIRFDGFAHNLVTSALDQYDDPDHGGGQEFGVHTHVPPTDPLPPATVPDRSGIFQAGRTFPVPVVDFFGMTTDLAQMRSDAQANGFYRAGSGGLGYHIVLNTNDTFDLHRVTAYTNPPSRCTNSQGQTGWSTWSINGQILLGNFPFPANGLIVLEDHIFVDGTIDGARLSIVAASFPDNPATWKSIIVNNDIRYTTYNGQDVIALIAQDNVNVGLVSANTLRIDAALVAKNGRVGRYYYPKPPPNPRCSPYHVRSRITLFGLIITKQRYGFAYTDGTGYTTRDIEYDANMLYGPPPNFPLTSDQYQIISWEESR